MLARYCKSPIREMMPIFATACPLSLVICVCLLHPPESTCFPNTIREVVGLGSVAPTSHSNSVALLTAFWKNMVVSPFLRNHHSKLDVMVLALHADFQCPEAKILLFHVFAQVECRRSRRFSMKTHSHGCQGLRELGSNSYVISNQQNIAHALFALYTGKTSNLPTIIQPRSIT